MVRTSAAGFVPASHSLATLARAVEECRGCGLFADADRAVFGSGSRSATMMLVGEQPGDQEDRTGRPFVGPAGRVLDDALQAAEVDREPLYVTNAVKHFKFTRDQRGKRRIHQTPSRTEVVACRPWLIAELTSGTARRAGSHGCDGSEVIARQRLSAYPTPRRSAPPS